MCSSSSDETCLACWEELLVVVVIDCLNISEIDCLKRGGGGECLWDYWYKIHHVLHELDLYARSHR